MGSNYRSLEGKNGGGSETDTTDWGFIYSKLAVEVGFSFRETDEHTLEEVENIFDFLGENPTSSQVLKAVYKISTNYTSKFKARRMSLALVERELHSPDVSGMLGTGEQSPLDDQFRESLNLANVLMKRMKLKNEN